MSYTGPTPLTDRRSLARETGFSSGETGFVSVRVSDNQDNRQTQLDETNRRYRAMTSEFTAEERAALSENSKILVAMMEAEDRGGMAEADRLLSTLEGPAHTLMAIKHSTGGADWIRAMILDTCLADEKYGPDWLDR